MKNFIAFLFFFLFFPGNTFGDAPWEKFHFDKDHIPVEVLKKTIGVVTINSGIHENFTIDLFDDGFRKLETRNIWDNSNPISNFGYFYQNDEGGFSPVGPFISNFRFPIIDKRPGFLKIIVDFKNPKPVWICLSEALRKFNVKVKYFENIGTSGEGEFVSLFDLIQRDERRLYSRPDINSEYKMIKRKDYQYALIKIVEQKGNFVRIESVPSEWGEQKSERSEDLGWVRIRDYNGALNIWIIWKDLC